MISLATGTVEAVESTRPGIQWLAVRVKERTATAFALTELTGEIVVGDEVVLNTTAVDLELGSGGAHAVACNLSRPEIATVRNGQGHIMKLRYTPLQHACLSVEEPDSPHHEAMRSVVGLDGLPVIAASLHSQVVPAVLGVRAKMPDAKISYVMTDAAALPAVHSSTIRFLRDTGLVDSVITCGNAFGGDLEAVNLFSALQAARTVSSADICVVSMGPGITGTGTALGHMGMEQGQIVNAAAALGGAVHAVARLSFADDRPRHQGLSHHTLNALTVAALTSGVMPLPVLQERHERIIRTQVEPLAARGWRMPVVDASFVISALNELPLKVTTMGRSPAADPEFFMAAAAVGMYAAGSVRSE